MVFDHRTIAIESMVLQSTIGDDGFSMVNEKKRPWFSKIAIYDKKLLLEFKLPTQIEITFVWTGKGRKASGRKTLAVEQPSEPLKRHPFAALSSINCALAACIYARTHGSVALQQ